ncbi:MAG: histidine kinase [Bacteroidales bacterium]|nr:histidine kinase [Bacteroidales bacterium]
MKSIGLPWIIHIFALLHAAVALACRLAGADDQILLTVLTMAMALVISMKMDLKIEFTAIVVIIVNILGFVIGTFGANVLGSFMASEYLVHCFSTVITTEILGWSIVGITKIFGQKEVENVNIKSTPYMKWILLIASGIFILRILIVVFLSRTPFEQDAIFEMIRKVMTNSFSLIILTCVNILFIRTVGTRGDSASRLSTIILFIGFMALATLMETFLVGVEDENFMLVAIVSLILQITVYCIVYMINYALTTHSEMQSEREKANMAQYRYLKLKRQVNPHFLFNSLNILDCLICEEKNEQASIYTHKLAGIYRYMIKSEDEEIVPLRDELVFVRLYIDLLQVRFPEGFEVTIDVPEDKLARFVPPCSIQLLIENATKHNAVSTEKPLRIEITADEGNIHVRNNIVPKVTKSVSTGLGQKYIRQLYMDLSGKSITIEQTENDYCVTLPLL